MVSQFLKNFYLIEKLILIGTASFVLFKQTKTKTGKIFPVFVLAINLYYITRGFFLTVLQYKTWQQGAPSKFLLPPYQDISYFRGYSYYRFFKPYLFNLYYALILFFVLIILNKIFKERFFEKNEPWVAFLGALIVPWPVNLAWLVLVLLIAIFIHLYNFMKKKINPKTNLVSLYYIWLTLAILMDIFYNLIVKLPILKSLVI